MKTTGIHLIYMNKDYSMNEITVHVNEDDPDNSNLYKTEWGRIANRSLAIDLAKYFLAKIILKENKDLTKETA